MEIFKTWIIQVILIKDQYQKYLKEYIFVIDKYITQISKFER